jgi:hypothetical protein
MEVGTAVDIYTTVLGWTLYDRLWEALQATGLAYLPFLAAIVRHFAGNWEKSGDQGAEAAIRGLELELAGMLTVAALAGAPVLDLKVTDLSHTAACGGQAVQGGQTGTLYDSHFNIGEAGPAREPVWWRAVMGVASGFSNVAIAATPCDHNLRQINYRIDNARIQEADLREQTRAFGDRCFGPARSKFARELRSLPAGFEARDAEWLGSRYFLTTAGFYDDPNPNLAPRAPREIPGFPYDAVRDADLDPPASGLGRPTCRQWWEDPIQGLRKRLLEQIDPEVLAAAKAAKTGAASDTYVEDAQIRRLVDNSVTVASKRTEVNGVWDVIMGYAGMAGTLAFAAESRATLFALQAAAPIGQSLILMAIYLVLPFVLVFSSYSVPTALLAGLAIFALRFMTALWALATWVDTAMVKSLGIDWVGNGDSSFADIVADSVGYLLFVGLPIVWLLALGWAGHQLAAGGLAGGWAEGVGRAAGSGIRRIGLRGGRGSGSAGARERPGA